MDHKINLYNDLASFDISAATDNYSLGVVTGWATKYYDPLDSGTNYQVSDNIAIRLAKDCFTQALGNQKNDIKIFCNHDMTTIPFARTSSGTAKVWLEDQGVKYSFSIPKCAEGERLLTAIVRKDIVGSSFTGLIGFSKWAKEGSNQVKTIYRFSNIVEISPCYDPAFSSTAGLSLVASLSDEATRELEIQARIARAKS